MTFEVEPIWIFMLCLFVFTLGVVSGVVMGEHKVAMDVCQSLGFDEGEFNYHQGILCKTTDTIIQDIFEK